MAQGDWRAWWWRSFFEVSSYGRDPVAVYPLIFVQVNATRPAHLARFCALRLAVALLRGDGRLALSRFKVIR
jgi:hypothetical protein